VVAGDGPTLLRRSRLIGDFPKDWESGKGVASPTFFLIVLQAFAGARFNAFLAIPPHFGILIAFSGAIAARRFTSVFSTVFFRLLT
jgi:hypothetical protein